MNETTRAALLKMCFHSFKGENKSRCFTIQTQKRKNIPAVAPVGGVRGAEMRTSFPAELYMCARAKKIKGCPQ
jgi:hypothetical protein